MMENLKKDLEQIHIAIKDNPFRNNYNVYYKFGEGYFILIYKFAETFYNLIKYVKCNIDEIDNIQDKKLANISLTLIHDMYGSVNRCRNTMLNYEFDNGSLKSIYKEEEFLEACISCIHCYIDTGLFYRYPVKGKQSLKWYEWNEEKQDYILKENI